MNIRIIIKLSNENIADFVNAVITHQIDRGYTDFVFREIDTNLISYQNIIEVQCEFQHIFCQYFI